MRWGDEQFVKLYTRDEADFIASPPQLHRVDELAAAQAVLIKTVLPRP